MKEADLVFGERYAVKPYSGSSNQEPLCMIVSRKLPPGPGVTRSRLYRCVAPEATNAEESRGQDIDASKILMPWTDYEKTHEYRERHLTRVLQALDVEVTKAQQAWYETVVSYVRAATQDGDDKRSTFVGMTVSEPTASVDDFVQRAMKRAVHTDIQSILRLVGAPLPSTSGIEEAIAQRAETKRELLRSLLPERTEEMKRQVRERRINSPMLTRHLNDLRETGTEGPHEALVALAQLDPMHWQLKSASEEDQFRYLIPYLDFTT